MSSDFTPEQKRYLEGYVSGLSAVRTVRGLGPLGGAPGTGAPAEPVGPDASHLIAQDRVIRDGKKLSDQEKFKREEHPFDAYDRLKEQAAKNEFPKPADNFRWRYYGLFYVAPNQNSYMCRLRIHNGILKLGSSTASPISQSATAAATRTSPRAPTSRCARSRPENAVNMVEELIDLGLGSRGTGADNIRNVTGTPTAGIDPQELIDTRPYAREWHHHILNERALYGLPRKFNVAFDGAGRIAVLEDTNDIGFQAVEVKDGFGVAPGVWFRLCLGGITGHRDFAKRYRGGSAACRRHRSGGRRGARVHRSRRPHQPQQGAAEIRARPFRPREVSRTRRGEARPQARPRGARGRGVRVRRSTAQRTSACIRRSSLG